MPLKAPAKAWSSGAMVYLECEAAGLARADIQTKHSVDERLFYASLSNTIQPTSLPKCTTM